MNEHGFIRSIHRRLPSDLEVWKINDNYKGGVADAYYSGDEGDLWVEYKFVKLPKRDSSKVDFGLSALQIDWLTKQANRGRQVAVIIGSDEGSWIIQDPQIFALNSCDRATFIRSALDKTEVVSFIIACTTYPQWTGDTPNGTANSHASQLRGCTSTH